MSEALWAAAIGGVLAPAMSTPFAPFLVAGMTGWGLYNAAVELKAGQYGLTIFDLTTIILLPKLLERIPQLGAGGAAADEGVEAVELIAAEEAAGGAIKGSPEIEALGTAGDEPARVSRCEGMECFTAGYRVVVSLNPDGTYQTQAIEQLHPGDEVLTRDQADPNGPLEERTVLGTTAHVVYGTEKVELVAADGQTQTLESTAEHPYWVEGQGWTEASELRPGEQVRTPEGGDLTVVAVQFQYQPSGVIVYNLVVDGDHTYFVQQAGSNDAVWVHNAVPCSQALSDAASAQDRNGLTVAGRSLTKHGTGARPDNTLFPAAKGNPTQINEQAQAIVDDILTAPRTTIRTDYRGRFGDTIEVEATDGRGLVYYSNGKFLFFKE